MDDYTVLKKIFPEVKDFFHINGKFVIEPEVQDKQWLIGAEKRSLLTEYGFRWFIHNNQIWVHDR